MRFNNRFCALMDIPDLPSGAFEHFGDKKIKPQGGNPLDAVSSALGTDGGGGGALGALADIDPGPAIGRGLADIDPGPALGKGLAEVDKFVGREIPGGWTTVGAAAAIAAAPYAMPYLTGAGAGAGGSIGGISAGGAFVPTAGSAATFTVPGVAAAGTAATSAGIASEVGQAAFFEALATGATGAEAISAGLAAEALAPAALLGPSYSELGITGLQQGLAGPTYAELGYTGLSEGLMGPTYGELGLTGLEVGTEASAGAPVFDFSQEVILSPEGNYIPANTLPSEIAGLDAQISAAGKEALAKYGGPTTAQKAIRGLSAARGLLAQQPQPQPRQQMQVGGYTTNPYGAVDYSGLLNLLSPRMARRNPNSLLG
jgi:hypothetical protein